MADNAAAGLVGPPDFNMPVAMGVLPSDLAPVAAKLTLG